MSNELVIKNGFISQGNSIINGTISVNGVISATTIYNNGQIISATTTNFTGGTISGATIFSNGLSSNTLNITSTPSQNNSNTQVLTRNSSTGQIEYRDSSSISSSGTTNGSFGFTIDGSGNVITSGNKGYLVMPYNGTINSWILLSDLSGSTEIDIWKDTISNYPPTSADTITGNNRPYLNSQNVRTSGSLTGWTTSFSTNDVFVFNVISATTITKLNLTINVTKN